MGEKVSTIVLKVDLECQRCYKKIRKVLCKIQDKMDIKTISFDEKSNSVTISGPFDAEKVCRKLCCHAGHVIKEMNIKGKESKDGGGDKPAAKPADSDAGKTEKPKGDKGDKVDKGGKADKPAEKEKEKAKAEKKEADKENKPKDGKPEKKVTFKDDDVKAPKADLRPLLEKIQEARAGPDPIKQPAAAQGVAVAASIWPAPASSLASYSYNPSYDPSYYGGGGYGCGCGYAPGYCQCGKPAAPGGYYGVPVYDNQGWYNDGRQPYYTQQQLQQSGYEDPNAGCSIM